MTIKSAAFLSDHELLEEVARAAASARHATSELLTLIGEIDVRRLYLGQACSSTFQFCTQVLRLSEHSSYHRIEAARAARQFPRILELLTEGVVTLTTVAMLRPHLTTENHEALLAGATHKSKKEVAHQIACLAPRPAVAPLVRKLPAAVPRSVAATPVVTAVIPLMTERPAGREPAVSSRPAIAPLASDRYLLRVTLSSEAHEKLRRAQDLLRHVIPSGDVGAVVDRALTLLVADLEKKKFGAGRRVVVPSAPSSALRNPSRYIPAAVRRIVWARDGGRCSFEGPHGRCTAMGRLEFHHVVPFADGGASDATNLALRCRAHNHFEGELRFGLRRREDAREVEADSVRTGPS